MENNEVLNLIIKKLESYSIDYKDWKKYLTMYIQLMSIPNISKKTLLRLSQSLTSAEVICLTDEDEKSVENLRPLLYAIDLKITKLPINGTPIVFDKSEFDERGFRKPEFYWTESQRNEMLGIGQDKNQPIPNNINIDKIYIDEHKPKVETRINSELLISYDDLVKKLAELGITINKDADQLDRLAGKKRR